jgi:hypothetical protein
MALAFLRPSSEPERCNECLPLENESKVMGSTGSCIEARLEFLDDFVGEFLVDDWHR